MITPNSIQDLVNLVLQRRKKKVATGKPNPHKLAFEQAMLHPELTVQHVIRMLNYKPVSVTCQEWLWDRREQLTAEDWKDVARKWNLGKRRKDFYAQLSATAETELQLLTLQSVVGETAARSACNRRILALPALSAASVSCFIYRPQIGEVMLKVADPDDIFKEIRTHFEQDPRSPLFRHLKKAVSKLKGQINFPADVLEWSGMK